MALAPDALVVWVTSPGTYLLPPHIRLHVLLKMSQVSQARHRQAGKIDKTQGPMGQGAGELEHCAHPAWNAWGLNRVSGPRLGSLSFSLQAGFPVSVRSS